MGIHVSNVCRVEPSFQLLDFLAGKSAGKHEIPTSVLPPRQIRITTEINSSVRATLKSHRGNLITVIDRGVAGELVRDRVASWEPQYALLYSMQDYLSDPDVVANPAELAKAKKSGADVVLVAIIGENRSPLAVCRNIVSGCQKFERLLDDAKAAMEAVMVYLVE